VSGPPYLQVGYISRAHGLRGELEIRTFDPASTALEEVERVLLRDRAGQERTCALGELRSNNKGLLVHLEGVGTREAAEALVGATVLVRREELQPPAEGEYFQGDLVGLEAITEDGARLGRVEEIWSTGPVPNLVIREGDQEVLVPFADEFVPEVRLAQGQVVVRPPVLSD
jgi:16S rRNA processing protein RimM